MGTIRIEPEAPIKEAPCESCGGTKRLMHGYVYDDEYAHGVYFVEWCDGDQLEKAAYLTVGLGAFGDRTDAKDRLAFGIEWRSDGMRLTDDPVRNRPSLLGQFVPRDEALKLRNLDHLWDVADHIVLDDPRMATVAEWLSGR